MTRNKKRIFFAIFILFFVSLVGLFSIVKSEYLYNLANVLSSTLIDLANDSRKEEKLSKLNSNDLLIEAAQLKANDMAEKGYFAHNSPDGSKPWYWLDQAGYQYKNAGENLAVNFTESEDVHNAWLRSPTHRANIFRNNFTEIGIATAEGYYKGQKATFVVQFFGEPK